MPGAGFLLNNEMGDFNAGPGLTTAEGLIGTSRTWPRRASGCSSSMTPTIVAKDGQLFMVTGSPGGRTIINTVLETIVDVVDFGMNAQEAVDAPRFHHQWLPDRLDYEKYGLLARHARASSNGAATRCATVGGQGVAQVIVFNAKEDMLEGGTDRRASDGARRRRPRADRPTPGDRGPAGKGPAYARALTRRGALARGRSARASRADR